MQFKGKPKTLTFFRAVGADYFVYIRCQCHCFLSQPREWVTPLKTVPLHICIIPDKPFQSFFSECIQYEQPFAAQKVTEGTFFHATGSLLLLPPQGKVLNMAMNFITEIKCKLYQYNAPYAKAEQKISPVAMMCP